MASEIVLVTGATGFVGHALVPLLQRSDWRVLAASRSDTTPIPPGATRVCLSPDHTAETIRDRLTGVSAVVHLAARVHVLHETARDAVSAYRKANVDATLALARAARDADVKRFVFVSSVKVFGEQGHFLETDRPRPADPYGQSKLEAELRLREFGDKTGLDVVIVRPPLVYGPGVKANFAALMRLVARGVPLPFGAVNNRRSYVAVDNLSDAIRAILMHTRPLNDTFTITDGVDLSTADLVGRLAAAMGRRVPLIPVPPAVLLLAATMIGRRAWASRLLGSLSFESARAQKVLGWTPPISVSDGLRRTVAGGPVPSHVP